MKKTLLTTFILILSTALITSCTWRTEDVDITDLIDEDIDETEEVDEEIEEEPEEVEEADVVVFSPQPHEEVTFPLTVTGEARGNWFFEAELNLKLLDNDGNELVEWFATSQEEEWMTMDFIDFEGVIEEVPEGSTGGTLVIEENNPASPEERGRDVWTFEVPVVF